MRALSLAVLLAVATPPQETATPVERIKVKAGFNVELLYSVPKAEQGSWVSLAVDSKGRLITSDQYGKLYRIAVGAKASDTKVETLDVQIGMAQGLLCAFDSLYVVVNGKGAQGSGVYRVRDTDGDDKYDKIEFLKALKGDGEHGPHGIVVGPDKKSLYVVAGNHTDLPKDLDGSLLPRLWQEDQLLPRMPDANGHAATRMAPGGYILRTDPDGKKWELVSAGYRNAYDIAFNRDGELFTYDSDMEWDMNAPWYRPTRVCHAVSGSEFGWRHGSGKWPAYYPDSLPAAVDIGPGSPTGIAFGYGAKFPPKYQEALYLCDWSYGKLYAVHLAPSGASYAGTFEEFVSAQPLPLTDAVVHPDGALYFTIGGRKTQSGLYRVIYAGKEPTQYSTAADAGRRDLRHRLEAWHGRKDPKAADDAWPHLGDQDRFIRFAARTAIEHQDVASWQDRALAEKDPQAAIAALVALARAGDKSLQPRLIESLDRISWDKLTDAQRLELLRAYGLCFIRMGRTAPARAFEKLAPASRPELNAELARMLCHLEGPAAIEKTLDLIEKAPTQEEQIHYAYCLRPVKTGWTEATRKRYLEWFRRGLAFKGGHSVPKFVANILKEHAASVPEAERKAFLALLAAKPAPGPVVSGPPRAVVRKWTVAELAPDLEKGLKGRSHARGREMFAAAGCFPCHRVGVEGGAFGPDLTGVAGRFSARDLLESVVEPSKVISDQYQAIKIRKKDGSVVTGRIINMSDGNLNVNVDMRDPDGNVGVKRADIEAIAPSETSLMPEALLDTLRKDEILDLMAYLLSSGNPDHAAFR
jgi:putative heme-binding domain-containing protein